MYSTAITTGALGLCVARAGNPIAIRARYRHGCAASLPEKVRCLHRCTTSRGLHSTAHSTSPARPGDLRRWSKLGKTGSKSASQFLWRRDILPRDRTPSMGCLKTSSAKEYPFVAQRPARAAGFPGATVQPGSGGLEHPWVVRRSERQAGPTETARPRSVHEMRPSVERLRAAQSAGAPCSWPHASS